MTEDSAGWLGQELAGGRYWVVARLGEGGMGVVYKARDRNLDTDVVVKVPRRALLQDKLHARRFAREVRSLVRLAHPFAGPDEGPFTLPSRRKRKLPGTRPPLSCPRASGPPRGPSLHGCVPAGRRRR